MHREQLVTCYKDIPRLKSVVFNGVIQLILLLFHFTRYADLDGLSCRLATNSRRERSRPAKRPDKRSV